MSKECQEILKQCSQRKINYNDGILPTKLFCRLYDVDRENNKQLASLEGVSHVFEATDEFNEGNSSAFEKLLDNCKGKINKKFIMFFIFFFLFYYFFFYFYFIFIFYYFFYYFFIFYFLFLFLFFYFFFQLQKFQSLK